MNALVFGLLPPLVGLLVVHRYFMRHGGPRTYVAP